MLRMSDEVAIEYGMFSLQMKVEEADGLKDGNMA